MIIKAYEYEKIKKINNKIFLFYGENNGYKNQIIKKIFVDQLKVGIERYEESEILNNYDNFVSGLTNKSFFEELKLILISRVTEKIIKLINEVLDREIIDVNIVLNADILEKKSKLRTIFEKNKNLVCVPFYKDDSKTLIEFASNFFKNKNKSISQEAINLIVERSSGDRMNLENELNKISNFLINKEKVSTEEILKLTNLSENYGISELADNCLAKNLKKINKIFNENVFSTDDCILIIRTLLLKSKRLFEIKKMGSKNKNLDEVISSYKPPIFWKDKQLVKNQVLKWNLKDSENLISRIYETELNIKKNYMNSINIVSDFIINTAK